MEVRSGDGRSVGSELAVRIGPGRWDTLVITRWDPPYRMEVLHTGSVVRGTGTLAVVALPGRRSRLIWTQRVDLPLGVIGRLGGSATRPLIRAGLARSLRALAEAVESSARTG